MFKRICVIGILLLFIPSIAFSSSQSSLFFGNVRAKDRTISEVVLSNDYLYMITSSDQDIGTASFQIHQVDLVSGIEHVIYKSNRRLRNLLISDDLLYFIEPNLFHNNASILCMNARFRMIQFPRIIVDQRYHPFKALAVNKEGLLAACHGKKGTEIIVANPSGVSLKTESVSSVNVIPGKAIYYHTDGSPHLTKYDLSTNSAYDTNWPSNLVIYDEVDRFAFGSILNSDGFISHSYRIFDKENPAWSFDLSNYMKGEYTFALLKDIMLIAQRTHDEQLFTMHIIELPSGTCIFEEELNLNSCLFKWNDQIYLEILENACGKIVCYDYLK